jgi:hypothetical protein
MLPSQVVLFAPDMALSNVFTTAAVHHRAITKNCRQGFSGSPAVPPRVRGSSATASGDSDDRWHITCKAQANLSVESSE